MPRYNLHPSQFYVDEPIAGKLMNVSNTPIERALVGFLWRFSCREIEMLQIIRRDIGWDDDYFWVKMKTAKRGEKKEFQVLTRTLSWPRRNGDEIDQFIESVILLASQKLPEDRLFPYSEGWARKVVGKIGLRAGFMDLIPYHFRHGGHTMLSEAGAGDEQLQYWKGAASMKSVQAYKHARPMHIEYINGRPYVMAGLPPPVIKKLKEEEEPKQEEVKPCEPSQ